MKFHKDKSGHWLPIIVQGDPHKPRAQPSVSVMNIISSITRVKKDALIGAGLTIEEGEAHDVKNEEVANIVHGSSSRKPIVMSSSQRSDVKSSSQAVSPDKDVIPVPNLDNVEDDSNVNHNEELSDGDQDPDGQVS